MNKQAAQQRKQELLEELGKVEAILSAPEQTPEELFLELTNELTVKFDKKEYPDSIFYFKGDKWMIEIETKKSAAWIRYPGFWSEFEERYSMEYAQIQAFMKDMMEKYFNCKVGTADSDTRILARMMEKHFNCKVGTALKLTGKILGLMEKHFNCKVGTAGSW